MTAIQTRETIFEHLVVMMEELFEVAPEAVTPEALLADDLDIDSIDAVDMAARLQQLTGHRLEPAAFKDIRTVADLVDATHALLEEKGAAIPA